ncbi:MAG TPA: zf-HC2 domain-containing protein [Gemmatimonadaceae bacterium]|nr:zf-HC2 domain-containing protein [Gemmatimonadaceae bacterium]
MTDQTLTCDAFDAMLPDYIEGTLAAQESAAAEAHLRECARCAALVHDMLAIAREASVLPDLTPPRDLWPGIEARLGTPVVPLRPLRHAPRAPRFLPRFTTGWIAAAGVVLMAATAGVTYQATKSELHTPAPARRAAVPAAPAAGGMVRAVANAPAEETYDQEIAQLRAAVDARRGELDPATVAVIERNLRIVDAAIAQSRAALAHDPGSQFLSEQLNGVLDQKVELLRTAALLPSSM